MAEEIGLKVDTEGYHAALKEEHHLNSSPDTRWKRTPNLCVFNGGLWDEVLVTRIQPRFGQALASAHETLIQETNALPSVGVHSLLIQMVTVMVLTIGMSVGVIVAIVLHCCFSMFAKPGAHEKTRILLK